MKRILFVTTNNLATNPRLVKEMELALLHGFKVTVLCCSFNNWSFDNNEKLKKALLPRVNYLEIPATRKSLMPWLLGSALYQLSAIVLKFLPDHTFWMSVRSNKRSWLLMKGLRKITDAIDLVVAHNPGSFYPAMCYAKKHNIPYGIDLEDYHAGETNDPAMQHVFKRLQEQTLSDAWYVSAASPLISEYANSDLSTPKGEILELLNYFEQEEFIAPEAKDSTLVQMVWFSQNIAVGRGLEEIIPLVKKNQNVILHLYGHLQPDFYRSHLDGITNILIHEAIPQDVLHRELSHYDVGLALEKPGSNLNRDLCITNKILAYQQAGLYIMASDTAAQRRFLQSDPMLGVLTSMDEKSIDKTIQTITQNIKAIRKQARERFQKARSFNWGNESAALLKQWNKTKL